MFETLKSALKTKRTIKLTSGYVLKIRLPDREGTGLLRNAPTPMSFSQYLFCYLFNNDNDAPHPRGAIVLNNKRNTLNFMKDPQK